MPKTLCPEYQIFIKCNLLKTVRFRYSKCSFSDSLFKNFIIFDKDLPPGTIARTIERRIF